MDSISLSARWNFTAPLSSLFHPSLSLSLLSSAPLYEPSSSHESTRNEITRCRYTCIYGFLARKAGTNWMRGAIETSNNKTFLQSQSAGRPPRHLPHSTYQSRRRFRFPWIANRPLLRNLNPLLQFSARLWRIYDTYLGSTPTSTPRVRSSSRSRFLGIARPGQSASIIDVEGGRGGGKKPIAIIGRWMNGHIPPWE